MTDSPLPGAAAFFAFLQRQCAGKSITIEGPEVVDQSYNMDYAKRWFVLVDGKEIGYYMTFGPKPGDEAPSLEYHGDIPGYVNPALVLAGAENTARVTLHFSNRNFEYDNGPGRIVTGEWKRHDGHTTIPFP